MRYLSLFSGIEACGVWRDELGWEPVAFAEIEPFPCAALAHHHPDVPNLGNIMDITEDQIAQLGHIDVVVGGSPCQDLSIAGKRQGMTKDSGTRSSLFHQQIRIFDAARKHNGARFLLWENVPGAFSSNKRADFAAVVGEMVGAYPAVPKKWEKEGLAIGPNGLLEWCVLDAQWRGLAQRRKRVFALLDTGDWASRPPILLEPQSLSGDTPPSREAGQGITHPVAPSLTSSGRGVERGGDTRGQDPVIAVVAADVSSTIKAGMSKCWNDNEGLQNLVAHTLKGDGFDGSEDGTGRGTPLVFDRQSNCEYGDGAIASTDSARDGKSATDLVVGSIMAFAQNTRDEVRLQGDGDVCGTLSANPGMKQTTYIAYDIAQVTSVANRSNPKPGDPSHPLHTSEPPLLIRMREGKKGGGKGPLISESVSLTIATSNDQVLVSGYDKYNNCLTGDVSATHSAANTGRVNGVLVDAQVRRITPRECARLQGFPDDYLSQVVWKKKAPADGVQYKALGNSMARNVMLYIGERIEWALSHG